MKSPASPRVIPASIRRGTFFGLYSKDGKSWRKGGESPIVQEDVPVKSHKPIIPSSIRRGTYFGTAPLSFVFRLLKTLLPSYPFSLLQVHIQVKILLLVLKKRTTTKTKGRLSLYTWSILRSFSTHTLTSQALQLILDSEAPVKCGCIMIMSSASKPRRMLLPSTEKHRRQCLYLK